MARNGEEARLKTPRTAATLVKKKVATKLKSEKSRQQGLNVRHFRS